MPSPLEQIPVTLVLPASTATELVMIAGIEGVEPASLVVRSFQRLADMNKRTAAGYGMMSMDRATGSRTDLVELINERCNEELDKVKDGAAENDPAVTIEAPFYNLFLERFLNQAQELEVSLASIGLLAISTGLVSAEKELSGSMTVLARRNNISRWHPYHFLTPTRVAAAQHAKTAA